jgi:hypothetical protein
MNPDADVEAEKWWASLTPQHKAQLYLRRNWW